MPLKDIRGLIGFHEEHSLLGWSKFLLWSLRLFSKLKINNFICFRKCYIHGEFISIRSVSLTLFLWCSQAAVTSSIKYIIIVVWCSLLLPYLKKNKNKFHARALKFQLWALKRKQHFWKLSSVTCKISPGFQVKTWETHFPA